MSYWEQTQQDVDRLENSHDRMVENSYGSWLDDDYRLTPDTVPEVVDVFIRDHYPKPSDDWTAGADGSDVPFEAAP